MKQLNRRLQKMFQKILYSRIVPSAILFIDKAPDNNDSTDEAMRTVQKTGLKGSLKWIQILVNDRPDTVNQKIGCNSTIDWVSPLRNDDLAEYRDSDFLKVLGLGHLQD